MKQLTACGCCACLAGAGKPVSIDNRPGLSAIRYRAGTHGTFFESMIRRLTVPLAAPDSPSIRYPLHALTTRELDDPAIALLDAWALVGDVLTFYQERIANESYLRTATERRSILELGRLVGYTLKPGVAASVYLAYTLEDAAKSVIPAGSKSQSVPPAGQQPQIFETSEDTEARGVWNALRPRLSRPLEITLDNVLLIDSIWIEGTTTRLEKRDPLLFVFEGEVRDQKRTFYALRRVLRTVADPELDRTEVVLDTVRPYYRKLYAEVWKAIATLPAEDPNPSTPKPVVALKKTRKKALPEMNASTVVVNVDPEGNLGRLLLLLDQVLLAVPRTRLQVAEFSARYDGFDDVFKALTSKEDPDPDVAGSGDVPRSIVDLVRPLLKARGIAPPSEWQFGRSLTASLSRRSDFVPRLLTTFFPQLGETIYTAVANIGTDLPHAQFRSVHVLRRRASVFGYNAPGVLFEQRPANAPGLPVPESIAERDDTVYLDGQSSAIPGGSYVVAQHFNDAPIRFQDDGVGVIAQVQIPFAYVATVRESENVTRSAYALNGPTQRLTLDGVWATGMKPSSTSETQARTSNVENLAIIRNAAVFTESEELHLAQMPIDRPVGKPADKGDPHSESPTRIEIDGIVEGFAPGHRIIVTGERLDTAGTSGVVSAELALVDNVEQQTNVGPGGKPYSILTLAPEGLAYQYKRATATILGNVVKATHGDSQAEILGSGDASRPLQSFTLHRTPLTFVSAPTIAGVVSTLAVRVNDVLWHETASFAGADPNDRVFLTKTADDGKVTVVFGNGREGSRLPTASDNVRAQYRAGIGQNGNAAALTITTAISRPLGVKAVVNPIAAGGGADPESRDDARRNIPVSLQALGRIVSIRDYADFARTFAGIAKATARVVSDGRRRVVHLTIGGSNDIDIDVNSDLFRNLVESLRQFGDSYQPLVVAVRETIVLAGAAGVKVHPDFLWAKVAPKIRAALLDVFSFDRRDFGQPIYPAEVVAAIQSVAGVVAVDLDAMVGLTPENILGTKKPKEGIHTIVPLPARRAHHALQPAQIAYLPPAVADVFILTEITNERAC
ncbi:MAG TPA: putative baseplate assembly protein [Thermoanaerobaculia bacterium]|nr:putative baseplate assembly protein [Thermoanaerobaculia bacterium]